jgi:GNAT superfamily N-acetyltransferase
VTGDHAAFHSTLQVVPFSEEYATSEFDCGEEDLTSYLCDGTAAADETAAFSCSYLVLTFDGELVGYFAVLADSIRLQGKEKPDGIRYNTAPAIKLGRMGVDKRFQGREVGTWILHYVVGLARAISDQVGVRYVTLDALDRGKLMAWYERYGFVPNLGESDKSKALANHFKRRWKRRRNTSMRFDVLLKAEVEEQ